MVPGLVSISNYSNPHAPQHSLLRKQVNSVYGAVNFAWDEYAYLDFTLRNDVSSTLSAAHRSYMYPSVSGSFVFSKAFGIEGDVLSFGKVRASWAKVGGDTDPYQLSLTYGLSDLIFKGSSLGIINSSSIPYIDLKPTSTYSYELGTDLRFFKGRLNLDLGYYYSSTKDQILETSDLVLGKPCRTSDDQFIYACSLGLGALDITVAYKLYQNAMKMGLGTKIKMWDKPLWE